MYRPIILILLFSTILAPVSVLAEWDWQNAEPQALNVKGRILTAVGSEIAPHKGITQFEITLPEELDRGQALAFIQRAFVDKGVKLSKKVTVAPQINGKRWLITDLETRRNYLLVYKGHRGDWWSIFELERVSPGAIIDAFRKGMEIRLKFAIIDRHSLQFSRPNTRHGRNLYFIDSTFLGRLSLRHITFSAAVNFSGSHFKDGLSFHKVLFNNQTTFENSSATRFVHFTQTNFHSVSFKRAFFADKTEILKSKFLEAADFSSTRFGNRANFEGVVFEDKATFGSAQFSVAANFRGAQFKQTNFDNTQFPPDTNFRKAVFHEDALFSKANFKTMANFMEARFKKKATFNGASFGTLTKFGKAWFTEGATFNGVNFGGEANFGAATFLKNAIFDEAQFGGLANFNAARLTKKASFRKAKFVTAHFRGARFSAVDFHGAHFKENADFSETRFKGKANFSAGIFAGPANFAVATFASDAMFPFTIFSEPGVETSFQGARFSSEADFSYASLQKINLSSFTYKPDDEGIMEVPFTPDLESLDDGVIPKIVKTRLTENFGLSEKVKAMIVDPGIRWLIEDGAFQRVYDVIKEKNPSEDEDQKKESEYKLVLYLQSQGTHIDRLNLIATRYVRMFIDSRSIGHFVFDGPAFERFIKQQSELGRELYEYQNAVLAFKRYERGHKWLLTRWMEAALFDWTTQYGTARIPWGLFVYALVSILLFMGLYAIRPNCLMFVRSDGSIDDKRGPPGLLEVFWFSVNTFTPAIEFFNAGNWRPKYDAMFPGGFIRFATIATIERIFGWAMVPALLSYF